MYEQISVKISLKVILKINYETSTQTVLEALTSHKFISKSNFRRHVTY